MTCSECGQKKIARCWNEFRTRKEHRCKDFEEWSWEVTKYSLQQTLLQGIGLPETAFLCLWDAAGTSAERVVPVEETVRDRGGATVASPPWASGSQEPAQDSSSEEEAYQIPLGETLPMSSDSTDCRERFPLGEHTSFPDCRGEVSLYVPHVEAAQMTSLPHDYYRVPALHLASGAPVYLVAPTTIPCPGLIFRDYPEFTPVPVMRPIDLQAWQSKELRTAQVMCHFYD